MSKSKIEWTDAVWNPVTGCGKVSEGCRNCYAERMSKRLAGRCGYPLDDPFRVSLHPDKLGQPLRWTKPRKIFVNSMSDLFHDDVPDEFIARVWWVMGQCAGYLDPSRHRDHTFMILTKRPERMKDWLDGWSDKETRKRWIESFGEVFDWQSGPRYWPDVLSNVWLGVSVENQDAAGERIPMLLKTPAAVRFISAEPLLGLLEISKYLTRTAPESYRILSKFYGPMGFDETGSQTEKTKIRGLDWVICGGESGPGARPMHPDWARSLRDQCLESNVSFFFKQWGEWIPSDSRCGGPDNWQSKFMSPRHGHNENWNPEFEGKPIHIYEGGRGEASIRVGKKKAGRELDGGTWDEIPEIGGLTC